MTTEKDIASIVKALREAILAEVDYASEFRETTKVELDALWETLAMEMRIGLIDR
jgi:predicted transcriptional regulator